MGFEETEEIGPDGKPHIISEKTFNPSGAPQPKLTKAQKQQQKQMQKEMQVSSVSAPCCAYARVPATVPALCVQLWWWWWCCISSAAARISLRKAGVDGNRGGDGGGCKLPAQGAVARVRGARCCVSYCWVKVETIGPCGGSRRCFGCVLRCVSARRQRLSKLACADDVRPCLWCSDWKPWTRALPWHQRPWQGTWAPCFRTAGSGGRCPVSNNARSRKRSKISSRMQ